MANISEVIQLIEEFAPPIYQESYDNSGLIVGNSGEKVKKVLLCLDCIEEVVDEAIELGCQLIVAHHPIVFKGLKSITGRNYVERTLLKAIRKNIAIYACHTNLDNMQQGVNAKIAEKLGLIYTEVLVPMKNTLKQLYTYVPQSHADIVRNALFKAGAGQLGKYDSCSFKSEGFGTFKAQDGSNPYIGSINELHTEAEVKIEVVFQIHQEKAVINALHSSHPFEEIAYGLLQIEVANKSVGAGLIGRLPKILNEKQALRLIKSKLQTECVRHTQLLDKPIETVALCGGSGSFLLRNAIQAKADMFITADFKYHEFFDADKHLVIADIGHYESEQFTYEIFSELLSKKSTTFAVLKTSVNTNPVNYYS